MTTHALITNETTSVIAIYSITPVDGQITPRSKRVADVTFEKRSDMERFLTSIRSKKVKVL